MDNVYENIKEANPNNKCKILIVFDDMIADMPNNKKFKIKVTGLFIRGRKLNISLVFITQSCFPTSEAIRLNYMLIKLHFIMKIPNNKELQKVPFHHSLDVDFKEFMSIYKKFTRNHILL